ncbi:MAG: tetratricopeptide repeat protein [Chroococcidiopsidaceae cyanobacterium CP_BM_ER_R8_30]|nr:tetratricopeptide repeat protein [Chroococcidiopsidaceae cyanobacterium CP_BM_ER_R8_30]
MATSRKTTSVQHNVSSDLETVRTEYQEGKTAFERGRYREAVQHLEKASALVNRSSRLGGEVQIWLAMAYEASGRIPDAIALCEQVKRHPDLETRKQGGQLLYIFQAPRLKRPKEWLTQIPDLGSLSDNESQTRLGGGTASERPSKQLSQPEPIDLSQVNTRDNRFIWVALLGLGLTLAGLFWWNLQL